MRRPTAALRVLPHDVALITHRRSAAGALAASMTVVVLLGVYHATHTHLGWFDRQVEAWTYRHLTIAHRDLAHRLADLGGGLPTTIVTLALLVWAAIRRSWSGALLAVASPVVAVPLTEYVLKPLFGRTLRGSLPDATNYPSGHTTAAFAGIAVASLFLMRPHGRSGRSLRPAVVVALIAAMSAGGVLVMIGLIGSQYHVATDTIGGVGVAVSSVLTLGFLIDEAGRRFVRPRQPVTTGPVSTTSNAEPGNVLS